MLYISEYYIPLYIFGLFCHICISYLSPIRLWPKPRKKYKFGKRAIPLRKSSPDSKTDFSEKSLLGIWTLILSRYDIILNIEHIIFSA